MLLALADSSSNMDSVAGFRSVVDFMVVASGSDCSLGLAEHVLLYRLHNI